jgi:hypothetical protein
MMLLNQLLRYAPTLRLVETVPGTTLLEVGSGSRGIAVFASARWQIVACDRDFSDYGARRAGLAGRVRRVIGDAADLPFADRSFDVVVSLDMLEHVPPHLRERTLTELARVARQRMVVGCPAGARALEADRALAADLRRWRRPMPPWLGEHLDNGFPEPDAIADALRPHGDVRLEANVALATHRALGRLEQAPLLWSASALAAEALRPAMRRSGGPLGSVVARLARALPGDGYRTIAVLERPC